PAAPGAELRRRWRSRVAWAGSMGGLCDLLGTLPGVLAVVFGPDVGSLPAFVWAFKLIRYAPGLAGLQRVISGARSALLSVLLATGFAEETRRREFLRTWDLVAKVPFFHDVGAAVIADVARLLRPRDYPAGAIIMRRGAPGDCMYFVASGEVEVQLQPEPVVLGPGEFFGEVALVTGGPRNATIVAVRPCTLLILDIVDFRELLGRQPELARIIH